MMLWILFLTFILIFIATAAITLLGVIGKVHVKEGYLKPLFGALVIEVIGVVISLFSGTNFFPETNQIDMVAMPEELQSATPEKSLEKVNALLAKVKTLEGRSSETTGRLNQCQARQQGLSRELEQCIIPKAGMISQLLTLQEDLKTMGPTINFLWQSERKVAVSKRVINVLGELGHFDGNGQPDPKLAQQLLASYQIKKGIEPASGKLGRKTFIQLLNDYMIVEANGG